MWWPILHDSHTIPAGTLKAYQPGKFWPPFLENNNKWGQNTNYVILGPHYSNYTYFPPRVFILQIINCAKLRLPKRSNGCRRIHYDHAKTQPRYWMERFCKPNDFFKCPRYCNGLQVYNRFTRRIFTSRWLLKNISSQRDRNAAIPTVALWIISKAFYSV